MSAEVEATPVLVARHGALHEANVKFGYIVLVLSVGFLFSRYLGLVLADRLWRTSGRATAGSFWSRIPRWSTVIAIGCVTGVLCLVDPHWDHVATVIRRLGRISYALVPLDIVLAARPAYIPLDNYLDTMYLHKWVSRIIVALGVAHGVGFFVWYQNRGELHKVLKTANLLGVVAFGGCCIMLVFWKPVRNLYYRLFYLCHTLFVVGFVGLITWHARPGITDITMVALILLFGHYFLKYLTARDITFSEIVEHPGSSLRIVKFPKQILPEGYLPGTHLRVGASKWSPAFVLFPSHPYTVATNYAQRENLASLVIKATRFQIAAFETYSLQPFFKSSLSDNFFNTAENVAIVCGGSGISLGLSVYDYLKSKQITNPDIHVKLIWLTRSEADVYVLNELGVTGVEVYVTNTDSDADFITATTASAATEEIELEAMGVEQPIDPFKHPDDPPATSSTFNTVTLGTRPILKDIVVPHLNLTIDYGNKWVVACGPQPLIKACKTVATDAKCLFFSEEYSM